MKKLLLVAAAALCATGCGRQWWNSYGCGQTANYGMADCCAPSCCDGGMGGDMVSPGFTTGYPAMPMQVMPGPEIVPAPGR
jgi:hypothetical protein